MLYALQVARPLSSASCPALPDRHALSICIRNPRLGLSSGGAPAELPLSAKWKVCGEDATRDDTATREATATRQKARRHITMLFSVNMLLLTTPWMLVVCALAVFSHPYPIAYSCELHVPRPLIPSPHPLPHHNLDSIPSSSPTMDLVTVAIL